MRTGIVILPELRWSEAVTRWRRAEEYGFDHAWTYDHLGWRDLVDGPWFDSVPTLAMAASVTSRIRLGTLVASPNFRHPVHLTREVTALDDVSGGRFSLGLGSGGGPAGTGFDGPVLASPELTPRQRADRFEEFVELLDLLLSNDRGTWHGEYFHAVDARSTPGCVQAPRVPFVVAANGPRAMRVAARHGQAWITTGGVRTDDQAEWWRGVGTAVERFDEIADGRKVARYLQLDAAPVFSMSSVECFRDAVGRAAELGFTDAITHWPRPSSWYAGSESVLERVAAEVLPELRA